MKKIWTYVSVFLTGIIAGLIAMYKLAGDRVTVNVKKQRIKGNSNQMILDIDPEVESSKKRFKRRKNRK